jgi:predicted transposase YbfD/YdcC
LPKKTFEIAQQTGNDFLAQVKENQQQLLEDCKDTVRFNTNVEVYSSSGKAHGRIEQRTVTVHKTPQWITDIIWQALVAAIIVVTRIRIEYNTKTKQWDKAEETSYYVCNNAQYAAIEFHDAIRNHWGIENCNHYVRDTAMNEDHSKIRKKAGRIARCRSFALNIMRANGITNISQGFYRNSLNFEKLCKFQTIFD